MLHTMKQAKMKPCGRCSPRGDSAGVHRKTKVYMEPSKRLCIAPSSAILGSAGSNDGWSQTRAGMLCMHTAEVWWQHSGLESGSARQVVLVHIIKLGKPQVTSSHVGTCWPGAPRFSLQEMSAQIATQKRARKQTDACL